MQGCHAWGSVLKVCAMLQQQLQDWGVAGCCGLVQRGGLAAVAGVDVDAWLCQQELCVTQQQQLLACASPHLLMLGLC